MAEAFGFKDYDKLSGEVRAWLESVDHSVSFSTLATFDPGRPRRPRLLVPVDVQALVVTHEETRGDIAVRNSVDGRLVSSPFSDADPLPAGVHLHWALPDALTAGEAVDVDGDGDLDMPPLPDRWLVARIGGRSTITGRRSVTAWVLESDVGAVFALEAWRSDREDDARPGVPLTSVVGGDVAWAAVYDNVVNRFAFHDPLTTRTGRPAAPRYTYVVMGWYDDPTEDPLHPTRATQGVVARLAELGWEADIESAAAADKATADLVALSHAIGRPDLLDKVRRIDWTTPNQCLFHGTVYSVATSQAEVAKAETRPPGRLVDIAVGPSEPDAVARLISSGARTSRLDNERLISAFSHGMIAELDSGGAIAVEDGVHRGTFESYPGGTVVEHVRKMTTARPDPGRPSKDPVTPLEWIEVQFSRERDVPDRQPPSTSFDARVEAVRRPLPRYHRTRDLSLAFRNLNRSLRHGYDGIFEPDETVRCRLSGQPIPEIAEVIAGSDIVTGLKHDGLPSEVNELLEEAALLDPAPADDIGQFVSDVVFAQDAVRMLRSEQQLSILNAARVPNAELLFEASRRDGVEPSPLGVTYWQQPWIPLYAEWEVELGLNAGWSAAWRLGTSDFDRTGDLPDPDTTILGRTLIGPSGTKSLSDQLNRFIADDELSTLDGQVSNDLVSLAGTLGLADVLTGGLGELGDRLDGYLDTVVAVDLEDEHRDVVPTLPFALLRAGAFRITRLRVVDAFGRVLDLSGRLGAIGLAEELSPEPADDAALAGTATGPARVGQLAPRLTRPARLMLRFRDGANPAVESRVDESAGGPGLPGTKGSPVVGWLLPDHADDALEFFDSTGEPLGQLFHSGLRTEVVWEGVPGGASPTSTGPSTSAAGGATMARLAASVLAHDVAERDRGHTGESPLSALMRLIDTTTWTVDPIGDTGLEHVSELIGRPIAVTSASVELQVRDDLAGLAGTADFTDEVAQARAQAYQDLSALHFPVRLGALSRFDDGLLGYFVGHDFTGVHPVDDSVTRRAFEFGAHLGFLAADRTGDVARTQVDSSYVRPRTDLMLGAGSGVRIDLTLLMMPGLGVSATTGLLPRKMIRLQRAWINRPLRRIRPSFRAGPILVDPEHVRLPKPSAIGERQGWTRRDTPVTWRTDPIESATAEARLPPRPFELHEGWFTAVPPQE